VSASRRCRAYDEDAGVDLDEQDGIPDKAGQRGGDGRDEIQLEDRRLRLADHARPEIVEPLVLEGEQLDPGDLGVERRLYVRRDPLAENGIDPAEEGIQHQADGKRGEQEAQPPPCRRCRSTATGRGVDGPSAGPDLKRNRDAGDDRHQDPDRHHPRRGAECLADQPEEIPGAWGAQGNRSPSGCHR
jgi:hypothetical protein